MFEINHNVLGKPNPSLNNFNFHSCALVSCFKWIHQTICESQRMPRNPPDSVWLRVDAAQRIVLVTTSSSSLCSSSSRVHPKETGSLHRLDGGRRKLCESLRPDTFQHAYMQHCSEFRLQGDYQCFMSP